MYKKIMVAVDGGETAKQALAEAVNIANIYSAEICIVHALQGDNAADANAGNEILAQAELSVVNAVNIETRLVSANIEYGLNGIVEAIAAAVVDWGADLLVVGTANRRGLERFFIGSVAEQLVSHINTSILLVRPQTT
jgi:nucleotide-binding universal stress UspA family protein